MSAADGRVWIDHVEEGMDFLLVESVHDLFADLGRLQILEDVGFVYSSRYSQELNPRRART